MNYEKIYYDFIKDRRNKEKDFKLSDYSERHHIIPKCMGGDDKKTNLIRLTPEDHFFAHLLLAKSFGGKNWLALHSMVYRQMKTKEIKYKDFLNKRKSFGLARRLVAKGISGLGNPSSDKNIYTLKNVDGREITGYRYEIVKTTQLNSSQVGRLINLKNTKNQSFFGWYYPKKNERGVIGAEISAIRKRSKDIFKVYHYDGREWQGTKSEFYKEFDKQLFFRNENEGRLGWFKSKESAENYLQARLNNQKSDRQWFKFYKKKTKEVFYGTKGQARDKFNLTRRNVLDITKYRKEIKGVKVAI